MVKFSTIKNLFNYKISNFPIWGWISCFLLIILLRYELANMIDTLLPIAIIVACIFYFTRKKQVAKNVLIFTVYSVFIIFF